jgi:hypothetical protein
MYMHACADLDERCVPAPPTRPLVRPCVCVYVRVCAVCWIRVATCEHFSSAWTACGSAHRRSTRPRSTRIWRRGTWSGSRIYQTPSPERSSRAATGARSTGSGARRCARRTRRGAATPTHATRRWRRRTARWVIARRAWRVVARARRRATAGTQCLAQGSCPPPPTFSRLPLSPAFLALLSAHMPAAAPTP